MRFLSFLLVFLVGCSLVFWVTWDYRIITDIRSARTTDGTIVAVSQLRLSHIFSSFQDSTEFYLHPESGKSYRTMALAAVEAVAVIPQGDRILVVYPDSCTRYKLVENELVQEGRPSYFGRAKASGYQFKCEAAVLTPDGAACFGVLELEEGAEIYRLDIDETEVSEPLVVVKSPVQAKNLECVSRDGALLLVWLDSSSPTDILYDFTDAGGANFGGKVNIAWNGYLPWIEEGAPSLLLLREDELVFDLYDLVAASVSQKGFIGVETTLDSLVAMDFDGRYAYLSDGISLEASELNGSTLTSSGALAELGKAWLPPEVVIIAAQVLMLAMLFVFSMMIGGGRSRGRRLLQPSNVVVRLSAFSIDASAAVAIALGVFLIILGMKGTPFKVHLLGTSDIRLFQNLALGALVVYGLAFELTMNTTPGKLVFGLTVLQLNSFRPRATAIVLRNLMKPVDVLLTALLITPLLLIVTPMNQRLGDLLAATVVVYGRKADLDRIREQHRITAAEPPSDSAQNDEKDGDGH